MAIQYSQKMPDMSRNTALAGKTVYSRGMNVTYDDNGYAVKASNPHHSSFAGTTRSVTAQPIEDALAGKAWTAPDTSGLRDWNDVIDSGGPWGFMSGGGGSVSLSSISGGAGGGNGYGSGGYPSAYDAQKAAYEAAVQRAVGQLTAQKTAANESYDDYARQAYRDKMAAQRDIDQYLGARGVTGGAAESTVLGLNTSYADELRRIEQSRRETLSALDQAIVDARLTGDINSANAAADAAKAQASLYAQEMAERKAAAAAQEQSARAEAQEQQSWARSLAGQMLAAGRMPDDATLAAAGITRTQAELLLTQTQTETEETNVYTPTFTVAQVQSEISRALRYGTPLSANVLRDYEFYYGEPYSPAYSAPQAAQPGKQKASSPSPAVEPIDSKLLEQLDAFAERGMPADALRDLLERWVAEKKITPAQREQIAKSFGY